MFDFKQLFRKMHNVKTYLFRILLSLTSWPLFICQAAVIARLLPGSPIGGGTCRARRGSRKCNLMSSPYASGNSLHSSRDPVIPFCMLAVGKALDSARTTWVFFHTPEFPPLRILFISFRLSSFLCYEMLRFLLVNNVDWIFFFKKKKVIFDIGIWFLKFLFFKNYINK